MYSMSAVIFIVIVIVKLCLDVTQNNHTWDARVVVLKLISYGLPAKLIFDGHVEKKSCFSETSYYFHSFFCTNKAG
jgi:hypothetical protein